RAGLRQSRVLAGHRGRRAPPERAGRAERRPGRLDRRSGRSGLGRAQVFFCFLGGVFVPAVFFFTTFLCLLFGSKSLSGMTISRVTREKLPLRSIAKRL